MRKIHRCRSCGSAQLSSFLELGKLPQGLIGPEHLGVLESRVPIELGFCHRCALVQQMSAVRPAASEPEDFAYFGLGSPQGFQQFVEELGLGEESVVLELGNPLAELRSKLQQSAVEVRGVESLGRDYAQHHPKAHLILAHNTLAETADPGGFIAAIALALHEDGVAFFESPYIRYLIEGREFDTLHPQHKSYFSVTSIQTLLLRHGLRLFRLERHPTRPGLLRFYAGKARPAEPSVHRYLELERRLGMSSLAFYQEFASRVASAREALLALLLELRAKGKRIAAYGASARAVLMLNYVGLGREVVEYVVDPDPFKQGLYVPGVHLPVFSPEHALVTRPDYLLILAWDYAQAVIEQQAEFARLGGKFIVPLPHPEIVGPVVEDAVRVNR
ncbi:methyltransferase C-terminal domain-containing protein [Calidithermus chliarophilus]|uniref:methyltransferase C-terminal domain-containing protein n=1 Tax=Calidithermus chliarophilus TaxID=52023 RepID=UPI000414CD79|nr:methyltransferase C-terminal domain-containing protein [Calidithermus chliarophilus]